MVSILVLQFVDDCGGGDGLGQVDHDREVVVQDVQCRYKTCSADFCGPLTGVLLVVADTFQAGDVLDCLRDNRVAARFVVVAGVAIVTVTSGVAGSPSPVPP